MDTESTQNLTPTQFEKLSELLKVKELNLFKIALKMLFSIGYDNFGESEVKEYRDMINSRTNVFISKEDEYFLLDTAIELSKFDFWTLIKFTKKLKI